MRDSDTNAEGANADTAAAIVSMTQPTYKPMRGRLMEQEAKPSVRLLSFATGVIAGTLAAIGAQIYLARMNVQMATAWHDLFVVWSPQFRSALAWWVVAGAGLIVGYLASALARFLMLHWWPLRLLRWITGAAIVAELAMIGHAAGTSAGADAGAQVGASLLGALLAMLAAMIGAGFGARN
jgi:hypothetical protein